VKLSVTHQETYSRGELLLRSFLGVIYIGIPHGFLLAFIGLWSGVLLFLTFWITLFTGNYPEGMFNFQVRTLRWQLRLSAALGNLADGYPALGLDGVSEKVTLEIERPASVNRGSVLLRGLLGVIYVLIPHGFALAFRSIGTSVLSFLAWFVVLFTGKYPERWHAFNVGTLRWTMRLSAYIFLMIDQYPRFSGTEDAD